MISAPPGYSHQGMTDRTLCFGGSFNPIHRGHLECAEAARRAGGFDLVLLIPVWQSPHKLADSDLAPPADRLAMCRLAATDYPHFAVSDLELRRGGPSFTIDAVRELKAMGITDLAWLIGADQVAALPRWRDAETLIEEIEFLLLARPGFTFDWPSLPPPFAALQSRVIPAPLIDISATEIRRRVRASESIDGLVPATVAEYIAEHALYRR